MPTRRGAGRTPGLLDLASDQATFSFLEEFDGLLISVAPMRQEASYVDFSTRMNNLVRALKICPGGESWFHLRNKPLADITHATAITCQRGRTSRTSVGALNLIGPTIWKGHSIWSTTCASAEGGYPTSCASQGVCTL